MPDKRKLADCLSILGTGSDVGKSIVAAALCRIFKDTGISVAPFKAQNMSNNSSVTEEGGEMGRAQVVQAQACMIKPHVDMNPVLLKPNSNIGSQVVLQGKPVFDVKAADYFKNTDYLYGKSQESLARLRSDYDLIIMEGAGSCGEVNLRSRDFVNFKTAHSVDAPVILVADIDRGGVFAQIIGTLAVIPEADKKAVKGIVINRFRGDATLFDDGIKYIEEQTSIPVLGLIPFYTDIKIDSEDSVPLDILLDPDSGPELEKANIAVIRFPHISNFTDFSPLENDDLVNLHYLSMPRQLAGYDIVILPGTKNVRADMEWLKKTGWSTVLQNHINQGGELGGICGGYQMLGIVIHDPLGVEGTPGNTQALGFLKIETTLESKKTLTRSSGIWEQNGEQVEGYEIHMGQTQKTENHQALIKISSRNGSPIDDYDGFVSSDHKIWGTYFHGLFNSSGFRSRFLQRLKPNYKPPSDPAKSSISQFRNKQYDLLAKHFRKHLDMKKLKEVAGLSEWPSQ